MLTATFEDVLRRIVREELEALAERLAALARPQPTSDLLTLDEAAALSTFSPQKVRALQRRGQLKTLGDARSVRVSRADLLAYLERRSDAHGYDPEAKAIELRAKVRRG